MFTNTDSQDIVELRKVNQSYDGGKTFIIKDLDLLIEDKPQKGQFISILGPSGCGKSTLLRYVCGLQKPTTGEVLIYGKPRQEEDRVGMVFQKYSSLPWLSVQENVELGLKLQGVSAKERREKAKEIIAITNLVGHEFKYAQYPTLSGGQLQRVAIARSLLANSRILVMDEPFGALDIYTRARMQDFLHSVLQKLAQVDSLATMIFVTHDIAEAVYLSDEIWIMGNAPASILHRIQTKLPIQRDRSLKRDPIFQQQVVEIEDIMMQLVKK